MKKKDRQAAGVRIDWIEDLAGIEDLRDEWLALEDAVQMRTPFSCYDFIVPWYRHYSGNGHERYGNPLLGAAWEDDRLVGVAPLTLWKGTMGKVPVRRIDLAGFNGEAGEFLVSDDMPRLVGDFIDSLVSRGGFDIISLNSIEPGSERLDILKKAASRNGLRTELSGYRYAVVDLSNGFDAYNKSLTSKVRNNLKRHNRKISKNGSWEIETIKGNIDEKQAMDAHSRMTAIYNSSWKVKDKEEMEKHHLDFYEELISRFSSRGMVDMSLLRIKGRDAAFVLWFVERGCYYDVTVSYDESFAHLSPGIFLMHEILKILPDQNIRTVVSHGDREYKKNWASDFVEQKRLLLFARSVKATFSHFVKFTSPRLTRRIFGEQALTSNRK